jgi:plasmid maintenance system antidote protein VapI
LAKRESLEHYINRLVKKHGTAGRVASMIGMSLSAFSRGVKEEHTLSVENCLRLADAVGDNAAMILRLAGKPQVADVVDRIAGKSTETLSRREHNLIRTWKTIDPDLQDLTERTIEAFSRDPRRSPREVAPRAPQQRQKSRSSGNDLPNNGSKAG